MTRQQRTLLWSGAVFLGLVTTSLCAYYALAGLDKADKMASIASSIVGIAALAASIYAILRAHSSAHQQSSGAPRQVQKSGENSINLQAGNDIQIGDNNRFN